MRPETYGELFAGISGIGRGLEAAGLEPRWVAETDPFCSEVLAVRMPGVPNLGDVREVREGVLPEEALRVDLIAGGFP